MKKRIIKWLLKNLNVPSVVLEESKIETFEPAVSGVAAMGERYDPDREFEEIATRAVKNPVWEFEEALASGKATVKEAWLYEGLFNSRGKIMESNRNIPLPYRIRYVASHNGFVECVNRSKENFKRMPEKIKKARESKARYERGIERLVDMRLIEDSFDSDSASQTTYDPNQYTEYTPTYGGPFNKQLYLSDYLTMHARAFEAKNHNPLAKRIIDVLTQYAFGRRFKVRVNDERKKKAWDDFEEKYNIIHKLSKYWCAEFLTYGEFMLDKTKMVSIDPSTVWDIITNPDDITEVYYYYQSYPTAFQTFTGMKVRGAPGSQDQASIEYIIRQLPDSQVIHLKSNVVSQEKRGRSLLFPILGWCKRIKDLYNAQVVRSQLEATFVWDDTITGSDSDIQAHLARYSKMPVQPSVFAHNDKIKRQAMPATTAGSGKGSGGPGEEILAFIATAIGIPKDFFNIMSTGGGNRATALVGAEPFEKVIQSIQAEFEKLGLELSELAMQEAGLDYKKGDVEFIFPSVTKDTTSETVKNIGVCETMNYIDHQTASEMAAVEMDITGYDYEDAQKRIKKRQNEMPIDPMSPPNLNNGASQNGLVNKQPSPIHGNGKVALKGQLNNV